MLTYAPLGPRRAAADKFVAWTLITYERVLHVDADVTFHEAPDSFLVSTAQTFVAKAGRGNRQGYVGLNTHIMLLEPDMGVFLQLVQTASSAQYFAYTNSEQDVIEAFFDGQHRPDPPFPNHTHMFGSRLLAIRFPPSKRILPAKQERTHAKTCYAFESVVLHDHTSSLLQLCDDLRVTCKRNASL